MLEISAENNRLADGCRKTCMRGCRQLLESFGKMAETGKGHEAEIPAKVTQEHSGEDAPVLTAFS